MSATPPRGFHELTIAAVEPETADGVAVRFQVPDALREAFAFEPGQYLTLRTVRDGAELRRSYSICTAPHDDTVGVGIKRVPGGAFSTLAQSWKRGDRVQAMAPQGRFCLNGAPGENVLLVASGSGITPCLSIARAVLERSPGRVTLLYGNRETGSIMFRAALDALKDRFPDRLRTFHYLSRERQDVAFLSRRLDGQAVLDLAQRGQLHVGAHDVAFVCGPGGMIDSVEHALAELGMAMDSIRTERFTAAGQPVPAPPPAMPGGSDAAAATVEIVLDGASRTVPMDPSAETVLSAAQREGLDVPWSCAGGMCCTCRCKVTDGTATMDVNYSLQDWEIEAGFVLACQARPTGRRLAVDFDAT